MALVLSPSSSRIDAELRLAQAVSQFEADLPSDEKAKFKIHKNKALQSLPESLPNIDDVREITASVDQKAARNGRGIRCFGPRLTNVLQAAQRFAAIGDILVGGSQNLIACGVWTAVRSTLLILSGFLSHLEKISFLFMEIGRSAPRYQDLSLLYPHSKKLQSYLAEYFILVVKLCHRLIKFTQKSRLGQFTATLSDPEMKTTQSDLDHWAQVIKDEVDYLMHQRIHEVTEKTSIFKALSMNSFDERARRRKLQAKLRVLDSCTTYDYQSIWKQTRKLGNTALLNRYTQYFDWKSKASSSTLICAGKLGCGKSVLLANVVDDLTLTMASKDTALAYFFCRYDTNQSLKARTIVGSIVRQILEKIQSITGTRLGAEDGSSTLNLDVENLVALLVKNVKSETRLFIVLDGLDECGEGDRSVVLSTLRELQKACSILALVSIRIEAGKALDQASNQLVEPTTILLSDENPEIQDFIDAKLESHIQSGKLVLGDPLLILEIRECLVSKAEGMFLWAALQIDALCTKRTDREIREALSNLPRGLPATFRRILDQKDPDQPRNEAHQSKILKMVSVAQRPLNLDELREALSVVPGSPVWDQQNVVNDIYSMLASCGGLIMVDEEDWAVRLVHHSVQQFLFNEEVILDGETLTEATANGHFAAVIATYLNFSAFDREVSRMVTPKFCVDAAPKTIVRSTISSSTWTQELALKLLRSPKKSNTDVGRILADAGMMHTDTSATPHHFFSYAQKYLLSHLSLTSKQPEWVTRMLIKAAGSAELSTRADDGRTHLAYFSELGNEQVVECLLVLGADVNEKDEVYGRTPLHWASLVGQKGVVQLLLEKYSANIRTPDAKYGLQASNWACSRGHFDVAELIHQHDQYSEVHFTGDSGPILVWVTTEERFKNHGGTGLPEWPFPVSRHENVADLLKKVSVELMSDGTRVSVQQETVWLLGNDKFPMQPVRLDNHKNTVWNICRSQRQFYECRFWIGNIPLVASHDQGSVFVFLREFDVAKQQLRGIGLFEVPEDLVLFELPYQVESKRGSSTTAIWHESSSGLLSTKLDLNESLRDQNIPNGSILCYQYGSSLSELDLSQTRSSQSSLFDAPEMYQFLSRANPRSGCLE